MGKEVLKKETEGEQETVRQTQRNRGKYRRRTIIKTTRVRDFKKKRQ